MSLWISCILHTVCVSCIHPTVCLGPRDTWWEPFLIFWICKIHSTLCWINGTNIFRDLEKGGSPGGCEASTTSPRGVDLDDIWWTWKTRNKKEKVKKSEVGHKKWQLFTFYFSVFFWDSSHLFFGFMFFWRTKKGLEWKAESWTFFFWAERTRCSSNMIHKKIRDVATLSSSKLPFCSVEKNGSWKRLVCWGKTRPNHILSGKRKKSTLRMWQKFSGWSWFLAGSTQLVGTGRKHLQVVALDCRDDRFAPPKQVERDKKITP